MLLNYLKSYENSHIRSYCKQCVFVMNQKHVFGYRLLVTNRNVFEGHENTPLILLFQHLESWHLWKWFKSLAQRSDLNLVGSTWSPNLRFQSLIGLTPERNVDYFFCM